MPFVFLLTDPSPIGSSMGESFNAVFTAVWSNITSLITTISTRPLLLIPVGLVFAGGVIGLAKGLMGSRRRRR